LITGGVDNTVRVWDLDALNPAKYVLYGHTKSVTTVAISPDGRTLASGGQDGTALVWNLDRPADPALALPLDKRSGSPTMLGDQEGVSALTFSSDGRVLVGGGAKGTLWLWNALALKATPLSIHAHASTIFLLSISHDGRWLASTSADGTIRLWLMDDLAVAPIILRGVGQIAYSTSFSPDDRWLAIGGDNGLVRLWPTQPTALIRQACATAGRNLTLDEWRQYISQSEPYHKLCPDLPRHPSVYADLLAHSQLGEALLAYQEDRSVNPTLDSEASWLVEQAAMLSQERPRQALLIYLLARWRDPQLKGANPLALNHICQASIDNLPTSILLDACDRLLANDSNDLASAYMRGRLRARLGDDAGALSDLQAAQHLAQEQQSYILEDIQRWIDDLKAGRDPLAPTPAAP
jgi:hypothetical protein